jgi:hypothetical protein
VSRRRNHRGPSVLRGVVSFRAFVTAKRASFVEHFTRPGKIGAHVMLRIQRYNEANGGMVATLSKSKKKMRNLKSGTV